MISFILKTIIFALFAFVIIGFARTWQLEHSPTQDIFVKSSVPSPQPDGVYAGTVPDFKTSWKGKNFNSTTNNGINEFKKGTGTVEKYPFKTSFGKGVRDKTRDVLKVDYGSDSNPFWLQPVLDEIVQTAPNTYLGKLQFRLIPRYPFTFAFFELKK